MAAILPVGGGGNNKFTPSTPIILTSDVTIKAIAVKDGMNPSEIMTAIYTVDMSVVGIPQAAPASGAVVKGTEVVLTVLPSDAEIWYTVNGAAPEKNGTGSAKYTSPIVITSDITIKAIGVKEGLTNSSVMEETYTVIFTPVTHIDGIPLLMTVGAAQLTLPVLASPEFADNRAVTWKNSAGEAITTFNPSTAGIATITATVANGLGTGQDFIKAYSINVITAADQVLWAWDKSTQPWEALPNNPGGNTSVWTNGYSGWKSNAYSDVNVSIYGSAGGSAQPIPADNGGMRVGGGTQGGQRINIGIPANTPAYGNATSYQSSHGAFDLSGGIIRLTIEYENLVSAAAGRYHVRFSINNNSGTAANSPLGSDSNLAGVNGGQLTLDGQSFNLPLPSELIPEPAVRSNAEVVYNGTAITAYPGTSNDGKGVVVITASPAAFFAGSENAGTDTLKNAFFQIQAMFGDADNNNFITYNSIKIEKINVPNEVIPVYEISDLENHITIAGDDLDLVVTVLPEIATNKNITWSVLEDPDGTGANFADPAVGTLSTTTGSGEVKVRATITNGKAIGQPFIKDFDVEVLPIGSILPVEEIVGIPDVLHLGSSLDLNSVAEVLPHNATHRDIIWWSIDVSDDNSATPSFTSPGVLTAGSPGTIKVLATITDGEAAGEDFTHVFTIVVPDPNLIFEWVRVRDGGLTAGVNSSNASIGSSAYVTGIGLIGKPVRVRGSQAASVTMTEEGIQIDGNAGGQQRVLFGFNNSDTNAATTATQESWTSHAGDFNFSSAAAAGKKIQISFNYRILSLLPTDNSRFLSLQLNNNTNTANASPLGAASRIKTEGENISLSIHATPNDFSTFSASFNPARLNDEINTLAESFICIGSTGGANSYNVIIRSVRIEYIPAPPVTDVTISGSGITGTGVSKALEINLAGESQKSVQLAGNISPSDASGIIVWGTNNAAFVDVDQSGNVIAKQVTTSPVIITATVGGFSDSVAVTVVDEAGDPNLIYEWVGAVDGVPSSHSTQAAWSSGSSGGKNSFRLPGTGNIITGVNANGIPVSIGTNNSNNTSMYWNDTKKGIFFEGSGTTATTYVLIVGSDNGRATPLSTSAIHAAGGVFDFLNMPAGKTGIRITLTGTIEKDAVEGDPASNRRIITMAVNNGTGTNGATPLGGNGRIFHLQPATISTTPQAGTWTPSVAGGRTGTFIGSFMPTTFDNATANITSGTETVTARSTLSSAFFCVMVSGYNATGPNLGADYLLTGIKIEYIEYID